LTANQKSFALGLLETVCLFFSNAITSRLSIALLISQNQLPQQDTHLLFVKWDNKILHELILNTVDTNNTQE